MKILIVGLGSIAKKHIAALKKLLPSCEIFALRNGKDSKSYENIIDLYNLQDTSEQFDFAIISNPTSQHAQTIELLKSFAIPLFIEKPLFDTINYSELVQGITNLGTKTYIACNLRFLDSLQYLKSKLINRRINEVNVYCGSYLPDWRPDVDFRKVYSANKEQGGGVHIDLIHEIDYIVWLFGIPVDLKKTFLSQSSLNISAFDYANYLFIYNEFCANIILNYYRRDAKRTIEVVCEEGTFIVDLLKNTVTFNGEIIFKSNQKILDTYDSQMSFFIDNLESQNEFIFNNINEAYNILKLCLED